jgi:glycosyltransferase involved in cell wall biosynthesis
VRRGQNDQAAGWGDSGRGTKKLRDVSVSVVIPALNEADCLPHVLSRIPRDVHEVILVDGLSTDGTAEVARRLLPTIRLVKQDGHGKGAALRAGFEAATGDIIVHLDADGSTDPAEIPAFVGALLAGADYAKGTRFIQGASTTDMTPLRRLGNKGFVVLANALFNTRFSDITYGYNAVWRVHRHKLAPEIDGWAHEIIGNIRAVRNRLRVVEVASRETPRIAGEAKLSTFSAGWTILCAMFAERFRMLPALPAEPAVEPAMATARPAQPHLAAIVPIFQQDVEHYPSRADQDIELVEPVLAGETWAAPARASASR